MKSNHPLIFVKFSGTDKTSISYRSDYGGQSIVLGYQRMKDRLIAENICKTDTTVRPRKDEYLYNMDCVNEALVNMLVHNDWTITEPLVAFYSDRIVFTSHGGISSGITEEEFYQGVSHPRNTVLMRIFLNMDIVEHTGYGISMIVGKYGKKAFDIHDSLINVTIPFNQNVIPFVPNNGTDVGTNDTINQSDGLLSDKEKQIILELVKNPGATYDSLASETVFCQQEFLKWGFSGYNKQHLPISDRIAIFLLYLFDQEQSMLHLRFLLLMDLFYAHKNTLETHLLLHIAFLCSCIRPG